MVWQASIILTILSISYKYYSANAVLWQQVGALRKRAKKSGEKRRSSSTFVCQLCSSGTKCMSVCVCVWVPLVPFDNRCWGDRKNDSLKHLLHESPVQIDGSRAICNKLLLVRLGASQTLASSGGQFSPYSSETTSAFPARWKANRRLEVGDPHLNLSRVCPGCAGRDLLLVQSPSTQVGAWHSLTLAHSLQMQHLQISANWTCLEAFQMSMCFLWAAAAYS